jgi:very-short-patch-repair endonuclease
LGVKIKKKRKKKNTNIEIKISKILRESGIKFRRQYKVFYGNKKCKIYDFYLKDYNLLIEADGDYWHANPNKYQDATLLTEIQKTNIENDKFKNELAKSNGYNLLRFWETDIKKRRFKLKLLKEIKKYG